MPLITREPVDGYAHCVARTDGILCEGEAQAPVEAIRETCAYSYADLNGPGGSIQDAFVAPLIHHSTERILFADPERDQPCPFCQAARHVSDQVRPRYDRLSAVPPDELLRRQRKQGEAVITQAEAATRSALAAERANELKERELGLREAELRAAQLREPLPVTHRRPPKPAAKVEA